LKFSFRKAALYPFNYGAKGKDCKTGENKKTEGVNLLEVDGRGKKNSAPPDSDTKKPTA